MIAAITCQLAPLGQHDAPPDARHTLSQVCLAASAPPQAGASAAQQAHVQLHVPLSAAGGASGWIERWSSPHLPVQKLAQAPFACAHNGALLMGALDFPVASGARGDCAQATCEAYASIFRTLRQSGYAHLLRVWNYIPHINLPNAQALETYRDFCLGRALAFGQHAQRMPAATAVGCGGERVLVYFLAARSAGQHLENPHQTPAWRYPIDYGPRPPSFARATAARWGAQRMFLLSGTASIRGHRSLYPRCAAQQGQLALAQMREMAQQHGLGLNDLQAVKIYVRHHADIPALQSLCANAFGAQTQVAWLQADICRAELLVEIEALGMRIA